MGGERKYTKWGAIVINVFMKVHEQIVVIRRFRQEWALADRYYEFISASTP